MSKVELGVVAISFVLAACANQADRKIAGGIDVTPAQAAVKLWADSQTEMAKQLVSASAIPTNDAGDGPSKAKDWFLVLKTGMNFSQEQCDEFIDVLRDYDKKTSSAARGVALGGSTLSAILGIAESSAPSIAITSSLFGLTSETINISRDSILFKEKPSVIQTLVKKAQEAYRKGVEDNPTRYDNRPDMMAAWAGYHRLCLPTFIEAQIEDAANQSDFATRTDGAVPELLRVGGQSDFTTQELENGRLIFGGVRPTPKVEEKNRPRSCKGDECELSPDHARAVQASLCIGVDANFGPATRQAISFFQAAIKRTADPARKWQAEIEVTGTLSRVEGAFLLGLPAPCNKEKFANAFERFHYGKPLEYSEAIVDRIEGFQKRLQALLSDLSIPNTEIGQLGVTTRNAITRFKEERNIVPIDGEITPALLNREEFKPI